MIVPNLLDKTVAAVTKYVHPLLAAITKTTTGATVISSITTNEAGHVVAVETRSISLEDLNYVVPTLTSLGYEEPTLEGLGYVAPTLTSLGYEAPTLESLGYTGALNANNYAHPNYVTTNISTSGASIVASIETNSTGHVTAMSKRTITADDIGAVSSSDLSSYTRKDSNVTFDAGTNTTVTIKSDDSGQSRINVIGDAQGTGVVYVGQNLGTGGGIAYNGDSTPIFSDIPTDTITLFRTRLSTPYWTAKNAYDSSDWIFRGDIYANETNKVYTTGNLTSGTADPSGGSDGDIYIQLDS